MLPDIHNRNGVEDGWGRVQGRGGMWGYLALPARGREDLIDEAFGLACTCVFAISWLPFILRGAKGPCLSSSRKCGTAFLCEGRIKVYRDANKVLWNLIFFFEFIVK